jgi:WD40 repeat protein
MERGIHYGESQSHFIPPCREKKTVIKKGLLQLTILTLIISGCASPYEIAQRTAQARQTPTSTPDLSAPALTLQPGIKATQNASTSTQVQPQCSRLPRPESLPVALWGDLHQQYRLQGVDPENGQPLCDLTSLQLDQFLDQAVSPDGKMLASFYYRDEYMQDGSLRLVNLVSWQSITTTVKINAQINSMAFNPAGDLLAFALKPQLGAQTTPRCPLYLFDLNTHQIIDSVVLDFIPRFMHFTANGKWLAIYGSTGGDATEQQPSTFALLLWANHLGLTWRQQLNILDGSLLVGAKDQEKALVSWSPGLAYAVDTDILYIVSANEEKFTILDYINRSVETKDIHSQTASWLEELLAQTAGTAQARTMWGVQKQAILSADGGKLFVTGQTTGTQTGANPPEQPAGPLGLQVIDLQTARQTAHLSTRAIDIQASPDGQYLFLRSWDHGTAFTDVLRSSSLEIVAHLPGQSLIVTHTFSGQEILLGIQESLTESQVSLIDPHSFHALFTWTTRGKPQWLTY